MDALRLNLNTTRILICALIRQEASYFFVMKESKGDSVFGMLYFFFIDLLIGRAIGFASGRTLFGSGDL